MPTKTELIQILKKSGFIGYSKMNLGELQAAVDKLSKGKKSVKSVKSRKSTSTRSRKSTSTRYRKSTSTRSRKSASTRSTRSRKSTSTRSRKSTSTRSRKSTSTRSRKSTSTRSRKSTSTRSTRSRKSPSPKTKKTVDSPKKKDDYIKILSDLGYIGLAKLTIQTLKDAYAEYKDTGLVSGLNKRGEKKSAKSVRSARERAVNRTPQSPKKSPKSPSPKSPVHKVFAGLNTRAKLMERLDKLGVAYLKKAKIDELRELIVKHDKGTPEGYVPPVNVRTSDMKETTSGVHISKCPPKKSYTYNFVPQLHQHLVAKRFLESPYKGMLLYHKLGSGKTCSAILVADTLLSEKKVEHVYVLTPGSLRKNFVEEYCNVCGINKEQLSSHFTFITYNFDSLETIPKDLDNTLVIVDEAHNFVNRIKNWNNYGQQVYKKLMASNCRILLLSGTPLYDNVFETPLIYELIKPGTFTVTYDDEEIYVKGFETDFFEEEKKTGKLIVKRKDLLTKLRGVVSYVPGFSTGEYPVKEETIIPVPMSEIQNQYFYLALSSENAFLVPPDGAIKYRNPAKYALYMKLFMMAQQRVKSRGASNFYYPDEAYTKPIAEWNKEDELNPPSIPDLLYEQGGWISKKVFPDIESIGRCSPKFAAIIDYIVKTPGKHMVFSFFKTGSGVMLLSALLELFGVTSVIYSGDISSDAQRKKILDSFNSVENRDGSITKCILVTDAGVEGITLKETQYMHVLEGDRRESKIQQAMGRVIRYKSHSELPPSERFVKVFRYWSLTTKIVEEMKGKIPETIDPQTFLKLTTLSDAISNIGIDAYLYYRGQKKLNKLNSALQLLQENSIEVMNPVTEEERSGFKLPGGLSNYYLNFREKRLRPLNSLSCDHKTCDMDPKKCPIKCYPVSVIVNLEVGDTVKRVRYYVYVTDGPLVSTVNDFMSTQLGVFENSGLDIENLSVSNRNGKIPVKYKGIQVYLK